MPETNNTKNDLLYADVYIAILISIAWWIQLLNENNCYALWWLYSYFNNYRMVDALIDETTVTIKEKWA